MTTKEVAALCYRRGWRDRHLITMVSIVAAETGCDENYRDDDLKRYGLFGLVPSEIDMPGDLLNPERSSKIARVIYEEYYFNPWPAFTNGNYFFKIKDAVTGVCEMYMELFER